MSTASIINIVLSAIVALTAIVSAVIAIYTLRQNNKMIEESTRPYVIVYGKTTYVQDTDFYLILKNNGNSGCIITSFKCNHDLSKFSYDQNHAPFANICNTFIAPNQSYLTNLNLDEMFKDEITLHFDIEYKTDVRMYADKFDIVLKSYSDLIQTRASTENKELKIISYTLQDLVEKLL